MTAAEMLANEALEAALRLVAARGEFSDFVALKPPKRGGSRESIPTAANALRRGYIDQVAATDESLRAAWRYGCYLFNNCCYICGLPFAEGEYAQADHVIPPELGGSTNAGNMLPAHSVCNDLKGNASPDEHFADRPSTLALLHHYRAKFNYAPDATLYPLALEKVSGYIDMMKKDILASRNSREMAQEDEGEDAGVPQRLEVSSGVQNLMRAVHYYLKAEVVAPSARNKMTSVTRRILHSWDSLNPTIDLFSQDEAIVLAFIQIYFLGVTDHRDSFNRTHRAFRILSEIFESKSLANIYTEGVPVTLAEMRESHEFVDGCWRPKEQAP
jgi:5-methylcytosine-specific restriction endonuclease McrA